jgi:hypothetical protein
MEAFVFGKGSVDFGSECESKDKIPVKFVLRVLEDCLGNQEFNMIITSERDKVLIHNSGTVKVFNKNPRSTLEICCKYVFFQVYELNRKMIIIDFAVLILNGYLFKTDIFIQGGTA